MKMLVLGSLNALQRDLRDTSQMPFGVSDDERLGYEALAIRVESVKEMVANYFDLADESARNAVRWKFLFQTPGITFQKSDNLFTVFKDTVEDGEITGKRVLVTGETLPKAVDKFLGFN